VLAVVPKPDVGYLLDAEPQVALERKPEYPLAFLHLYRQSYLTLRRLAGLTLIPPATLEEVHVLILKALPERDYQHVNTRVSLDSVQL